VFKGGVSETTPLGLDAAGYVAAKGHGFVSAELALIAQERRALSSIALRDSRTATAHTFASRGDIEVSVHHGSELIETHKDEAIRELMYFGHTCNDRLVVGEKNG
jgi:hypothetical protein